MRLIISKPKEEDFMMDVEQSTEDIILSLDSYQDIFSDFDPRPYSKRALSQDLLVELNKASLDKHAGKGQIVFILPKKKRRHSDEILIHKRLKEHFDKHYNIHMKDRKAIVSRGMAFAILGIALMFIGALVLFKYDQVSLASSFMTVILEPAGWFFFWEGLYMVFFDSKNIKPQLEFYMKMAKSKITFESQ